MACAELCSGSGQNPPTPSARKQGQSRVPSRLAKRPRLVAGEDFCHVGIGGMSAQDRDQHVAEVGRDRQIAGADEGVATCGSQDCGGAVSLQELSPVEFHHSSGLGREGRRGRRGRWLGLSSESLLGIWLRWRRELRGESSSSLATGSGAEDFLGARLPPRPLPRSLPRSLPRPESDVTNAPQPLIMLHGKMTNQPATGSR